MYTQFLFDDKHLLGRRNAKRVYGKPEPLPELDIKQPGVDCMWTEHSVVRDLDGRYRLYYQTSEGERRHLMAVSEDGLHFSPEPAPDLAERAFENQYLPNLSGTSISFVYRDDHAPEEERFKALATVDHRAYSTFQHEEGEYHAGFGKMGNPLFVSQDGKRFRVKPGSQWNNWHAEGSACCYFRAETGETMLEVRPDVGDRRICLCATRDWIHFTDPELALESDALDPPLTELYGMRVYPVDGMYVGFLWLYRTPDVLAPVKYFGGRMYTELAYSPDGRHFIRSLRRPFIPLGHPGDDDASEVWISSMHELPDGSMVLAASICRAEHAMPYDPEESAIRLYRLRKHGFVALETDAGGESEVTTRAYIAGGGALRINIDCLQATCALFEHESLTKAQGLKPVPGFGHADCQPFSGDSTAWLPAWHGGTFDDLAGRAIIVQIRFAGGRLYSISGALTPTMYWAAERYAKLGSRPDYAW